jgi:divalent metal cation (Fe/Co/Zn/Cd) transporter
MRPDYILLALFVAKIAFKATILRLASSGKGAAFSALAVDARNDILVGAIAVIGFAAAKAGSPAVDAWLAIPAALWIGWSGVDLARENIDLLLGVAPPVERQRELLAIAEATEGIVDAHDLVAHTNGVALTVHLHVTVDASLTVLEGHDLGEAARLRLLAEDDVGQCSVHVDPST